MHTRRLLPLLAVVVLLGLPARAQDPFEIQVYSSNTASPLQVGAEMHLNHFLVGTTTAPLGERPTDRVTHLTIEPHIGIASWCEAGTYFLTAIRADGTFDFAGLKVRFKVRWPEKLFGGLGLSLNQELSMTRVDYEPGQFGWELRPIIDYQWRWLYLATNPIIDVSLGGLQAGQAEFEPGFKAAALVLPFLSVGAEYLASLGPIGQATPLGGQSHRLFGALDFEWRYGQQEFELNLGVGYDFTGPEKWIVKLIFAVDIEPTPAAPAVAAGP